MPTPRPPVGGSEESEQEDHSNRASIPGAGWVFLQGD